MVKKKKKKSVLFSASAVRKGCSSPSITDRKRKLSGSEGRAEGWGSSHCAGGEVREILAKLARSNFMPFSDDLTRLEKWSKKTKGGNWPFTSAPCAAGYNQQQGLNVASIWMQLYTGFVCVCV